MADRIAVMVDGRIVQIGRPHELYNEPADVRVAEILGSPAINVIEGRATLDDVDAGGLKWPLDVGRPGNVLVGFRPEAATIAHARPGGGNARVARIEHLGNELLLHLALADGQRAIVRAEADFSVAPGVELQVTVPAGKLLLFDEHGARVRPQPVGQLA